MKIHWKHPEHGGKEWTLRTRSMQLNSLNENSPDQHEHDTLHIHMPRKWIPQNGFLIDVTNGTWTKFGKLEESLWTDSTVAVVGCDYRSHILGRGGATVLVEPFAYHFCGDNNELAAADAAILLTPQNRLFDATWLPMCANCFCSPRQMSIIRADRNWWLTWFNSPLRNTAIERSIVSLVDC